MGARQADRGAPTATLRDAPELLDIHVHQFAGPGALIAADDPPGWPVHEGQAVQMAAGQDAVGGGGRKTQDRADAGRAELALDTQRHHPRLDRLRGSPRAGVRSAGAVEQATLALGAVAREPLVPGGT
jgi:hypothetical protein